jgi:hypothetical protein
MDAVMSRRLGTLVPLTALAALVSATLLPVPVGSASSPNAAAARTPDRVPLVAPPGDVVRSATVDLAGARQVVRAEPFSMVALTWSGPEPRLRVRTRGEGGWSRGRHADPLADGPSPRTVDGATHLLWTGPATAVQVRNRGAAPTDLDVVLIDPGRLAGDRATARSTSSRRVPRTARLSSAPPPELRTRRDWGADNSWRNGRPHYNDRLRQVHVHHTATGNDYSRADVPGILRGMYRYHTETLGWFDLGYNFLVDRFGRSWVGRSGGPDRLVRGAHTLGFNDTSVGLAVIGNLEDRRPWRSAVTQLVRLAAWKLDRHGRDATGRVRVTSTGSDRYEDGERVRLPVIDGHRDTNETACPGDRLYAALPAVRRRAQARIDRW